MVLMILVGERGWRVIRGRKKFDHVTDYENFSVVL